MNYPNDWLRLIALITTFHYTEFETEYICHQLCVCNTTKTKLLHS